MEGRVLVIDDDLRMRESLAAFLLEEGLEVEMASSVSEALVFLETFRPQVALLDLVLDNDDGLEFLRELSRKDRLCQVVIVTGYGSLETAVEAMRLGCRDYLLKPVDREELLSRLEVILKECSFREKAGRVIPMCCVCGKVRDDDGQWMDLTQYMMLYMDVLLSHTYCPTCFCKEIEGVTSPHEEHGCLPDERGDEVEPSKE